MPNVDVVNLTINREIKCDSGGLLGGLLTRELQANGAKCVELGEGTFGENEE